MRMPGMTGLELQKELRARSIAFPIIFLTGAGSVAQAVSAMHAGAVDFLEKPVENADLVERVHRAIEIDRAALQEASELAGIRGMLGTLTPREKEVLVLLSRGQSNKVVARNLALSPRTVEGYRARILEKLQARSVAQLVRIVELGEDLLRDSGARESGG
jgi:FixJ family two-component response regulator